MASKRQDDALSDVVDLLPEELGEPKVRQRLQKFTKELDKLLFLDESGTLSIDPDALTKAAHNTDFFPPEVQALIARETEKHLGGRAKARGKGRRVSWRDAARQAIVIQPGSAEALRELGIDGSTPVDKARRIVRKQYPEIPNFCLDADAVTIRETVIRALAHNQTVWDCVVRHLGYWGALAVFAALGGILIVGTATGPWGLPLAIWLIGVLGGGTAAIVLNCVLNPSWA
jgi:hypothetical protein